MNQQYTPEQIDHILSKISIPINRGNLPTRAISCLYAEGIYHVGTLLSYSEMELRKIPNLGRITLNEIGEFLKNHDLKLGQFSQFQGQVLKDLSLYEVGPKGSKFILDAYSNFFSTTEVSQNQSSLPNKSGLVVTINIDPNLYDVNSDRKKLSADFANAVTTSLDQFARQKMLNSGILKEEGAASDTPEHGIPTTPINVEIPKSFIDLSPLKLDFLKAQSEDSAWQKQISDEINRSLAATAYDQARDKLAHLQKAYGLGIEKS